MPYERTALKTIILQDKQDKQIWTNFMNMMKKIYYTFFFIRASKIQLRLNVLIFRRFSASKCSQFVLIF